MDQATSKEYAVFQRAYDFFNKELFAGELPGVLITLQRKSHNVGMYRRGSFKDRSDLTQVVDEIAINPDAYVNLSDVEIWQALVHEMCHQWQFHFGKPSRKSYHNREWANKMESIGLIPSSTGKPGGARIGQTMFDYVDEAGRFRECVQALRKQGVVLNLQSSDENAQVSRSAEAQKHEAQMRQAGVKKNRSNRVKYSCPQCQVNAWGKPELHLICGDCQCRLEPV
ncbi:SprT-like domain-containing protein [Rubritalea tangerina]|uniref:SprT-like domain-containing protein n=1 Tax=Rubritalea tangerina TaxID=430798 RepID=A0ABW4Z6Q9_9BACT